MSPRRVVLAAVAVAALSSSSCTGGAEVGSAQPTTPSPSSPTATAACVGSDLTVQTGQKEGTAGTAYTTIVVTNVGAAPCTLAGFPQVTFTVQPVSGASPPPLSAEQRGNVNRAQPVVLPVDGRAYFSLGVPDPLNFAAPATDSGCRAVTVVSMDVGLAQAGPTVPLSYPPTLVCSVGAPPFVTPYRAGLQL